MTIIRQALASVLLLSSSMAYSDPFLFVSGSDFGWLCREPMLTMQIVKMFNRDESACVWNREEQADTGLFRRDYHFSYVDPQGAKHYLAANFEGFLVLSDYPVEWDLVPVQSFETSQVFLMRVEKGPLHSFVVGRSRFSASVILPIYYEIKNFDERRDPDDSADSLFVGDVSMPS